jgi:hypothetical protein
MKLEDYFQEGKEWKLRLHEKRGKLHVVPAHDWPWVTTTPLLTQAALQIVALV